MEQIVLSNGTVVEYEAGWLRKAIREQRQRMKQWQEDVNKRLDAKEEEIRQYKESHKYIYEDL